MKPHPRIIPMAFLVALAALGLLAVALLLPDLANAAGDPGRSSWGLLGAVGVPSPNNRLALPGVQAIALAIGTIVPLGGYVLNHYAPWVSEPVKTLVQAGLAAAAGALVQLLDAGDLALDVETLEVVGIAVIGAFAAHSAVWTRSGISTALGGGSNSQTG